MRQSFVARVFVAAVVAALLGGAAAARADQDDPRLDRLFARLNAPDAISPEEVNRITAEIWNIWRESGSPSLDMMMLEGQRFMKMGTLHSALGNFDFIIKVDPEFAEAWHKRATVYYMMGDYKASIADIEKTVSLEPRHFGAYAGLGLIMLKLGNEKAALKALERALEINPHLTGTRQAVEDLKRRLNGRNL